MGVLKAVLLIIGAFLVSIPATLMIPFSIPGTCADNACIIWGLFVAAAVAPFVLGPALIVATLFNARARIRAALSIVLMGTPAIASAFVVYLIATAT